MARSHDEAVLMQGAMLILKKEKKKKEKRSRKSQRGKKDDKAKIDRKKINANYHQTGQINMFIEFEYFSTFLQERQIKLYLKQIDRQIYCVH